MWMLAQKLGKYHNYAEMILMLTREILPKIHFLYASVYVKDHLFAQYKMSYSTSLKKSKNQAMQMELRKFTSATLFLLFFVTDLMELHQSHGRG